MPSVKIAVGEKFRRSKWLPVKMAAGQNGCRSKWLPVKNSVGQNGCRSKLPSVKAASVKRPGTQMSISYLPEQLNF
jgi:hypothetical protein